MLNSIFISIYSKSIYQCIFWLTQAILVVCVCKNHTLGFHHLILIFIWKPGILQTALEFFKNMSYCLDNYCLILTFRSFIKPDNSVSDCHFLILLGFLLFGSAPLILWTPGSHQLPGLQTIENRLIFPSIKFNISLDNAFTRY